VVRAGTPPEVVRKLSADVTAAVRHPDVREKLVAQGFYPVGNGAEEFGAHLRSQLEKLRIAVKEAGITAP
jgi:tripartite-type tricarboxylate transporter receptor subunit TctC